MTRLRTKQKQKTKSDMYILISIIKMFTKALKSFKIYGYLRCIEPFYESPELEVLLFHGKTSQFMYVCYVKRGEGKKEKENVFV